MAFVSSRNLAYAAKVQRRRPVTRLRVPYSAGLAGLDDDQLGSIFGKVAKGIKGAAKGVGKGFTAVGKASFDATKAGAKATSAVAKFIPKAAAFTGKTAIDAAFLPSKTAFSLAKGIGTSFASNAGKLVGGVVKLPFDVGKSLATGVAAPFKSAGGGGDGGGGELAPPVSANGSSYTSSSSPSYGGGGGGYDAGGGGGGGGELEQTTQGLMLKEGMPLWQKLALGAVALVGAYFLYKKFGKGGRSAGRSKSRR